MSKQTPTPRADVERLLAAGAVSVVVIPDGKIITAAGELADAPPPKTERGTPQ